MCIITCSCLLFALFLLFLLKICKNPNLPYGAYAFGMIHNPCLHIHILWKVRVHLLVFFWESSLKPRCVCLWRTHTQSFCGVRQFGQKLDFIHFLVLFTLNAKFYNLSFLFFLWLCIFCNACFPFITCDKCKLFLNTFFPSHFHMKP